MKTKISYSIIFLLTIISAFTFLTCKKVDLTKKTMIATQSIESITQTNAIAKGHIIDLSESNEHSEYGFCWDTLPDPIRFKISLGTAVTTGDYTKTISGLRGGKTYNLRAFVKNDDSYIFGKSISFITPDPLPPTVSTTAVTNITDTTAISGGKVTSDGGANIISRGVCWSTSQNPTLANSYISSGADTGSFTSKIKNFSLNSTYYIRAFAINKAGTSYGNQLIVNTNPDLPTLTTITVSNITYTSASCGGNIITDGGGTITARGLCWNTTGNPTISDAHINGSGTGSFTSDITGLVANTTYHVKAHATNSKGTAYGNEVTFTTNVYGMPVLTTNVVINITSNSATSGGNITDDGGQSITSRGVCWSTSESPTITNSQTSNGTGSGSFASLINSLNINTTYYVRAYASNASGINYGNQLSFTTIGLPSVTTNAITNITNYTALSGGNILNDGGSPVSARGICWSVSQAPNTSNSFTSNGTGIGSFSSNITTLTPNTTYYVRAYATNSAGTAYGNEISFASIASCGVLVDVDGNSYNTVIIGSQCWMRENLKTTKYRDGTLIPNVIDNTTWGSLSTDAYCDYNNISSNSDTIGRFYNWYSTTNSHEICPTGWHVPSDLEWSSLIDYLGGTSTAGGKMKIAGITYWNSPNTGATNSSGFSALPCGSRSYTGASFASYGIVSFFWSSSEVIIGSAYAIQLHYTLSSANSTNTSKNQGFSIRCLKD